jgi:hypothetical protein
VATRQGDEVTHDHKRTGEAQLKSSPARRPVAAFDASTMRGNIAGAADASTMKVYDERGEEIRAD